MAEQAALKMTNDTPTSAPQKPREVLPIGERGSEKAAAMMWDWRDKGASESADIAGKLRKKGLLQGAIGLTVAGIFYALGFQTMSIIVSVIASITLITAIASPTGAYAAIEGALTKFASIVGSVVAWLVLMPIFVGFFVPFGLIFRRGDKDPMKRFFSASAPSYWREREPDTDVEGRRKSQF